MQFNKIWANTRYEVITLLRGWFFRIAASLILIILVIMSIALFSSISPSPRVFRGFSASIPYANLLLLNLAQMIIIIFISGDFFKRDRKLNTSEVFYIRSMSNASYLMGKALGVFILFLGMNFIVITLSLVIHLIFSETTFNIVPYVLYPLLISLPSFTYMLGLSFILMRLIKNQAVVVLVLIGYFALTLFFLSQDAYFLFDFFTMQLPLAYSDFVGFANLEVVIIHRTIYFLCGLLFISLTIIFFTRLSQEKYLQRFLSVFSAGSAVIIFLLIFMYLNIHERDDNLRIDMNSLNEAYLSKPSVTPISNNLVVHHKDDKIIVESKIHFINKSSEPISDLFFSLNPGFDVSEVIYAGSPVPYKQKAHILDISLLQNIKTDQSDSLIIKYQGSVDDAANFSDIPEITRREPFSFWLFQVSKKHAFLEKDYVLLSPESMWYPRPGLPNGIGFPDQMNSSFVDFTLTLFTDPSLTAISQGTCKTDSSGKFIFVPEYPLPSLSLIIGPYIKQTIQVDSIEFGLYTLPNHDYYLTHLSAVGDTLGDIIKDTFQDYEVRLDLNYPYKRLSLVEVPLNFFAYPRVWTTAQDVIQPEQVWIQENAATISYADFKFNSEMMERRSNWSNQTLTDMETQTTLLTNFINYTFLGKSPSRFFFGGIESSFKPNYNIFPNFYSFNFQISDPKWQIFNNALEAFLFDRVKSSSNTTPPWMMEGISEEEEANILLRDQSLSELLSDSINAQYLPVLLKQKGSFLVKLLQNRTGVELFNTRLKSAVSQYRFKDLTLTDFLGLFGDESPAKFAEYLDTWYNSKELPSFYIYQVDLYKVMDNDRIRNQAMFSIYNLEEVKGLIEVSFDFRQRGRGMSFSSSNEEDPPQLYNIEPGQTKKIGILLDEEPRAITINFLIAKNLPLSYSQRFDDAELNERKEPFHGETILADAPVMSLAGEIIVDNEDSGFVLVNPPQESVLKRLIHKDYIAEDGIKYKSFRWWSPPPQWTLIKNAAFFGTYIHSAYYIRAGDGKRQVSWIADIDESGIYDIYTYMFNQDNFGRRRRRGRDLFGEIEYRVIHDSGEEIVNISADEAPEGWNYMGSWYLSAGKAEVILTNKSNARVVMADAVKWVKN